MSIEAAERGHAALDHILQAIECYRITVGDLSFDALVKDFIRYHAAERFVEIISEASRRLPPSWTTEFPEVPWADVASVGNVIRHRYDIVDQMVIYDLQHEPFAELERVIREIKRKHGLPSGPVPRLNSGATMWNLLPGEAASVDVAGERARLKDIIARRSFRLGEMFRLVSGVESNVYFNMKPTMFDPEGAALMAKLVVERLAQTGVDAVGGLEMGAVPIVAGAVVESHRAGRPIRGFFVRKKAKEHGARLRIEGLGRDETLAGRRVAIIDDVCTTGGSALQAIEEVRAAGGEVVLALAIIDREEGAAANFRAEGVAFDALFKAHEFIPAGFERLPPAQA